MPPVLVVVLVLGLLAGGVGYGRFGISGTTPGAVLMILLIAFTLIGRG